MSIAIKVDEDLPVEVADILRRAGHDAQTVIQEGLTGTPDEKLWKVVQQERRCLFTADKGFSNARLFSPARRASEGRMDDNLPTRITRHAGRQENHALQPPIPNPQTRPQSQRDCIYQPGVAARPLPRDISGHNQYPNGVSSRSTS